MYRTDRLHRQSTFCPIHCASGDAASGEARPGSLFIHWATLGVVVSTGHGCCCSQGPWDMYPLGHPGGEPQPHHFEWRTTVFSHAPHLCMPPMSKLAILLLGCYVYLYILIELCVGAQCCTFHHGIHMQEHPGPVRRAQGVMLDIIHSTMINRGKLMGQHSRGGHC